MITRRAMLRASLAAAASAFLAACKGKTRIATPLSPTPTTSITPTSTSSAIPACVVKPQLTEGPYFVDERLDRSDIRTDTSDGSTKDGVALRLAYNVSRLDGTACARLPGAQVDVWHCDAAGLYSDQAANNTVGKKFLRGYQVTDANGVAQFLTIFPGWYQGRAIHIHFKIRTFQGSSATYEFTSQLFFEDATIAEVLAQPPYKSRGSPDTPNASDGIYRQGGSQLVVKLGREGTGYAGTFDIGLQMS
jgi:protocatechuate 3,4-dioxygenase beta subunit